MLNTLFFCYSSNVCDQAKELGARNEQSKRKNSKKKINISDEFQSRDGCKKWDIYTCMYVYLYIHTHLYILCVDVLGGVLKKG